MCGIAGIFYYGNQLKDHGAINDMTQCLSHRGPDATSYWERDNISLGHKRLSIIDLDQSANQPMADQTGRYHIVFNGEIYNFQEIRLKTQEYSYLTNGDTETILAAYTKWGTLCLDHIEGMFAFAIWDDVDQELFVARDRLGVKPFYYHKSDKAFVFASEIRSLLSSGLVSRRMNMSAVSNFLQFQSVQQPHTMVDGVQALEPGTYMTLSRSHQRVVKYWNVGDAAYDFDFADSNAVKRNIHDLLFQSVERRMVSDVPIGAFLSGGIDSSAVVGLMASISESPVNTFTVGFDEKDFDESEYASIVARKFNTNHQIIKLKPSSFIDELLPALTAMDTPSGDGVNSYVVSKAIRASGITVALSGVGGDELFAGYPFFNQYLKLKKFDNLWNVSRSMRLVLRSLIKDRNTKANRYKQILALPALNISNLYPIFRQVIAPRMIKECTFLPITNSGVSEKLVALSTKLDAFPLLSQVSIAEYLGYTSNTLLNDMDQMSMAVSLEVREPFFDHHLIEFVLGIPDSNKISGYPKKLLVESLGDLLPDAIVHRKKQGFLFPWNEWMKNELRSFCGKNILSMSKREFIKEKQLIAYWNRFLKNDPSVRWMEIWLFVVLEYWLNKNDVS